MTHIDALWECADLLLGKSHELDPTEAFILGGAFLLHDAGLALASYPGGPAEVRSHLLWQDCLSQQFLNSRGRAISPDELKSPPHDVEQAATETFLRLNHAAQASKLGTVAFSGSTEGAGLYLIEDAELRSAFGELIGAIAYSHWWSVEQVVEGFGEKRGGLPGGPADWTVDPLRLALILRASDAIQLDARRAPAFRRALRKPSGEAEHHWHFQGKMLTPTVRDGAVVFTSSGPFGLSEAEAWWVGQDLLQLADRELRAVDATLQQTGHTTLQANHVKGASSSKELSRLIRVDGWSPVSATLHVSNLARLVERLGGRQLYGNRPHVALRELIQNARDAVVARRLKNSLPDEWGKVHVELREVDDKFILSITDNGVGMSKSTLSGALLDFGTSFWQSQQMLNEHPGLAASGFEPTGKYGIGFFSVFLLGDYVRVISRRPEDGESSTTVLEFQKGVSSRIV
ncbi:MAG: HD domain-containing protein, partial [Planctomycetota bacterium]